MLRRAAHCVAVALLWTVTSCSTLTEPTDIENDQIATLWTQGQNLLLQVNERWIAEGEPPIPGNVLSVQHTRFHFVPHSDPIFLAGEQVGGYFNPNSRTIHYHEPVMEGCIPHEAGHAILYELGDPRWLCVFHDDCP